MFFLYKFTLAEKSLTKPHPRMILVPKAKQPEDIDEVAKIFLNQAVSINWPHCIEANVVQIFNATKKIDGSTGHNEISENPQDFAPCVEALKSR